MQEISNPPNSRETGEFARLTPAALREHAGSHDTPPIGLAPEIEALWLDAHGDAPRALQIVDEEPGLNAVWIRAYARRMLGDEAIASYGYAKAIRPVPSGSSVTERDLLLKVLIGGSA